MGGKNKSRRKSEGKEEDVAKKKGEEEEQENVDEGFEDEEDRPSKRPRQSEDDANEESDNVVVASGAMPLALDAKVGPKSSDKTQPVIVLLDQATLETVKRNNAYELLNCDDHRELVKRKLRKDPNSYRPDILHQELLALQDSPLNKAGLLKIYVVTEKKVLIDIHPATRIPRTYKRFAGLMVQLLHKMKIKAADDHTTLLKIIKNPFLNTCRPEHDVMACPLKGRCIVLFNSRRRFYRTIIPTRKRLPRVSWSVLCPQDTYNWKIILTWKK